MQYNITRLISRSRKYVTILFTDIVDSTQYWDTKGDIKGRLMVDQHNRLVFPVVTKFNGKVIKTIGDSVMASFSSPENALKAAIGIQQSLDDYRRKNKHFKLEIRIGMHTGKALVEKKDVFGDTVNVAARVEGAAKANEILISGSTEKKIKRNDYALSKKTSFIPKGKRSEIVVYKCDWAQLPSLIKGLNFNAMLPMMSQQRSGLFLYLTAIIGFIYFIVYDYLRYVIADQQNVYLLSFNPQQMLNEHPIISASLVIATLVLMSLLKYLTVMPVRLFKIIKGGFGYAVVFFASLMIMNNLPADYHFDVNEIFHESKHLFVEVLHDNTLIREQPSLKAKILRTVNARDLLLLADVKDKGRMVWNKVLIGSEKYGWVARAIPASFGVEEKRLTIANKFYFKKRHLYALIMGIAGFLWGFFSFSIRPL
ncbi:MAG: adenylate/guanylate cyclase domain-containing protein [Woeseiaceae bacterium]